MVNKLKPAGIASSMESALTYTSFTRSAPLLSGNVMKIFRFRDRLAGGALYSGSHAVSFNRALDVCKLTGAVLFCVGGTSMAVGLLLSAFAKSYSKEELYLQQKFKERLADLHATVGTPIMKAPTPGEGKVPVTLSKVQNIQPVSAKSET
ncbi:Neurensin-1 [Liparis tanakae]|uniref:Neurensin-1 n=1 Tax=Liparis tanakae TaxID=230148 RepID=A0A4Z2IQ70_9TELE|nr:Neurensin-1 [Liparis tanakae]